MKIEIPLSSWVNFLLLFFIFFVLLPDIASPLHDLTSICNFRTYINGSTHRSQAPLRDPFLLVVEDPPRRTLNAFQYWSTAVNGSITS